jgi:ParB-like nuclease domain
VESKRGGRRLPNLALLTNTIEAAQLSDDASSGLPAGSRLVQLRLDALWLDHQPREIVPEERLQRLIADRRAQPAALLDVLRESAASDPYYAEILERLDGLARSIAAEGVLQPIQVVSRGGRLVVRDGHRRCLASLLAGRDAVPAVQGEEPSELTAVAHALIVNLQREDLTALEKGGALLRLALLVAQRLSAESGEADTTTITLDTLLGGPVTDDAGEAVAFDDGNASSPAIRTTVLGRSRALAAQVRNRVCEMVGIQGRTYYRHLALNRLSPDARPLARGLTENQLRPIVSLPPDEQPEIVAFAVRRQLSAKETTTLAQVARSGDHDAVRRVMARLAKADGARERTSVSWDALLHAVPRDVWQRCQSLRAELAALSVAHRRARLDAMWEQDRLLLALHEEFQQIFEAHGYQGPGTSISEE